MPTMRECTNSVSEGRGILSRSVPMPGKSVSEVQASARIGVIVCLTCACEAVPDGIVRKSNTVRFICDYILVSINIWTKFGIHKVHILYSYFNIFNLYSNNRALRIYSALFIARFYTS